MSESTEIRRRIVLREARLLGLCRKSAGSPDVRIALVDGPVHTGHPLLATARVEQFPHDTACATADARHATFIASILVGNGPGAIGVTPRCTLVSLPVHDDRFQRMELSAREASARIAHAIDRALALRADVIQLSMEFLPEADAAFKRVIASIERAALRGVCTVIAAGNRSRLGASAVLAQPGVLPVSLSDPQRYIHANSPLGLAVGGGVRCPGIDIPGAIPPDRVSHASGSSYATAIACGALALLKSLCPQLSTLQIAAARPGRGTRSLVPPVLDAQAWFAALRPAT